jgi:hypothetical protein
MDDREAQRISAEADLGATAHHRTRTSRSWRST